MDKTIGTFGKPICRKNNTVWKAKLRIANSINGEKLLYKIFPTEKVEEAQAMGTTTTNPNVAQPTPNVNNNV